MNLIIAHEKNPPVSHAAGRGDSLLRFALANEPIAGVVLDGLGRCLPWDRNGNILCAIPEKWNIESRSPRLKTITYIENVPINSDVLQKAKRKSWFIISNAQFATQIDERLLNQMLDKIQADVLSISVEPDLLEKKEKMRLTAQGKVAGFRRLYYDSVEPARICENWPHHIIIRTGIIEQLLVDGAVPQSFSAFLDKCRSNSFRLCGINMGGIIFDLETQKELLNFCRISISKMRNFQLEVNNSNKISRDSKLVGKVLLGNNIYIGPKTTVVGPTIIGNNVRVEEGTVINSSIIGSGVSVPPNKLVQDSIVEGPPYNWELLSYSTSNRENQINISLFDSNRKQRKNKSFRCWSRFSYTGSLKRIIDFFVALIVLILFAPIIPFIALAIKLTSPGPVFFRHKRQGRYGKIFDCLKFRTMKLGADKMQDKLRFVSKVDGPQFKIDDDPRINVVGRFLRETYLDEIPQFINVLLGQMSVVGPRPSPESENTLCPFWRDARLSVRPGITGLWQIHRTRQPMKDFQEWIHYDTEYVRNLSLKMDLWIAWKTTKKLFDNFISQF
jgi:lipopolysaccharide/colanic/teichoic acid biosynthesis glycosyltransferase/acetyltransferase-like isoleucine patch superfamily enzyme